MGDFKTRKQGWDVDKIVRVSDVCVILHNMLIKMVENGDVQGAVGVDLVTELR